jgi:RNA polymerase sigma factor (sigma-70 family)
MTTQLTHWISSLCVRDEDSAHGTDAQLLQRFLDTQSGPAFAVLLRRHGPMVLSVCWRVLGQVQDAEDVFQATFVVLARVARSIRKMDSLAAWLHGVALRLARRMKHNNARRRQKELNAPPLAGSDALADLEMRELGQLLHEELHRLPWKERQPLLLCHLEGLTQEQAAAQLGWSRGTLKRRLERGRSRLRSRLVRRGVALSGIGAPLVLDFPALAGPVTVSAALGETTVRSCVLVAGGCALSAVQLSPSVHCLVQGALRHMMFSKLRLVLIAVLMIVLTGAGAWYSVSRAGAPQADPSKEKPKPEAKKPTDIDRIQGIWRIVRGETSGAVLPQKALETQRLTFNKEEVAWETTIQGGFSMGFKIDPSRKPGHIDLNGAGRLPPMAGIYKFEGKKLILALSPVDRPEGFVTNQQSTFFVYELERVEAEKPKDKPARRMETGRKSKELQEARRVSEG